MLDLRDAVRRLLHHPGVELTLVGLILGSVGLLLFELALPPTSPRLPWVQAAGDGITLVFVVELTLRFAVAPSKVRFFLRYWPDLLSVLPLARPLRLLRVLTLLRLFRAGVLLNRRFRAQRGMVRGALRDLAYVLVVAVTLVLLGAVTVSLTQGAITLEEDGLDGSLWFALFTFIGGEPIGGLPANALGRLVTLLLMFSGLTVFGMAVGTMSATMAVAMARRLEAPPMDIDELQGHVVVCGWNRSGPVLVAELFAPGNPKGRAVVIVHETGTTVELPGGLPRQDVHLITGDATRVDTLLAAGIQRASVAICLTDDLLPRSDADRDARTVLTALTIERLNREVFCCAELTDRQNESLLKMHGVEEIIVGDWYAGVILGAVGRNRGLVAVLDDILTSTRGNAFYKVRIPSHLPPRTVREWHALLASDHDAILVSVEWWLAEGRYRTEVNPPSTASVEERDRLVVIARRPVVL